MDIYRGDTFKFDFNATLEDGTNYEFQPGYILKVGIKEKLSNSKCAVLKTLKIEEATEVVSFIFPHEETKKWCEGDKLLEVELTNTRGEVTTLYQGKIKVIGDVIDE
jgi:hypothetical protein